MNTITKEYFIKVTYTGDQAPDNVGNVETAISAGIENQFSGWGPNTYVKAEALGWIDVNERHPEEGQTVLFIVVSRDSWDNDRILGGRYLGFRFGFHEFSIPGIGYSARWWMPIPNIPKPNK